MNKLSWGIESLLGIKDSDIRLSVLDQGWAAVDKGVHMGGAMSAVVPMVSIFYGGYIRLDVQDPTRIGQDMFVLSKGHAVATLASIYADLGYFPAETLKNSRSVESILNGHPGPLLPGIQIATGPLAQGIGVAQGFALAGKRSPRFDVFVVTGDGELQEGVAWEAIMYAPQARLDNLCMVVDKNEGQLDNSAQLLFSMDNLPRQIESFGWRVLSVDGTSYSAVTEALSVFRDSPRDGRPTAIVCNTKKGFGTFSDGLNKHKVTLSEEVYRGERALQEAQRMEREAELLAVVASGRVEDKERDELVRRARSMNLTIESDGVVPKPPVVRTGSVPLRDKRIRYDEGALPRYVPGEDVAANTVITTCMNIFAADERVVSVDADLGSTSGLKAGIAAVDQFRGINVGIAEANMMCIGEAWAALGRNAWVSTFCPFFDWKVLRRIAVGAQERRESIADPDGWLSEGHGLDLTFLATASNFDTRVNGATHMGNDDSIVYRGIGGLKIIDVFCPNQLVNIMKWIMAGNRGLVYLRIMRAASAVIYEPGGEYVYGRATVVAGAPDATVHIVSSGRGVHEALAASRILEKRGVSVEVVDMHSYDGAYFRDRLGEGGNRGLMVVAEQNNGFLWNELTRDVFNTDFSPGRTRIVPVNTTNAEGEYQYIHSATYPQLVQRFHLDSASLAETILNAM